MGRAAPSPGAAPGTSDLPPESERLLRACASISSLAETAFDDALAAAAPLVGFGVKARLRALAAPIEPRRGGDAVVFARSAQSATSSDTAAPSGPSISLEEIDRIVAARVDAAISQALSRIGLGAGSTVATVVDAQVSPALSALDTKLMDHVRRQVDAALDLFQSSMDERFQERAAGEAQAREEAERRQEEAQKEVEEARAEVERRVEEAREALLKDIDEVRTVDVGFNIDSFAADMASAMVEQGEYDDSENLEDEPIGADEGGEEEQATEAAAVDSLEEVPAEAATEDLGTEELADGVAEQSAEGADGAVEDVAGIEEIAVSDSSHALASGDVVIDDSAGGDGALAELDLDSAFIQAGAAEPVSETLPLPAAQVVGVAPVAFDEVAIEEIAEVTPDAPVAPLAQVDIQELEELDAEPVSSPAVEVEDDLGIADLNTSDLQSEAGIELDLESGASDDVAGPSDPALSTAEVEIALHENFGSEQDMDVEMDVEGGLEDGNRVELDIDVQIEPASASGGVDLEVALDDGATEASAEAVNRYLQRASEMRLRKQTAAAMELYNKVLDMDPRNYEAHIGRGVLHLESRDFKRAADEFSVAEQLDATRPAAALGLAEVHFHRKQFNKAIRYYSQCLTLDDRLAQAYCNRGLSLYYQKNYKKAFLDLMRAYELDPELPNIRKYLKLVKNKVKAEAEGGSAPADSD